MTTHELLDTLQHSGIELTVNEDRLRVDAPRGTLTPELRRELLEHKSELIAELSQTHGWPAESLDAERRFGVSEARLYPFLGESVETPPGPGRLLQVYTAHAVVILDSDPKRATLLLPSEVLPPELEGRGTKHYEAVH